MQLTRVSVDYLVGQVRAGAQMLQVFESNAGELAPAQYREFALPYLLQIAAEVKAHLSAQSIPPVPMVDCRRNCAPHRHAGRVLARQQLCLGGACRRL